VNVYPFIEAERQGQGDVRRTCALPKVSRAAYYAWAGSVPCARRLADEELLVEIVATHRASRGTYGSPRITRALRSHGLRVGRKRIARLMARGLAGRARRRRKRTTITDPKIARQVPDLLQRNFDPTAHALDTVWCGDISYVRTWEGWSYLATVMDVSSRRVVGLAMADHLRTSLVSEALQMALTRRRPAAGLIFHADRGCQYASAEFRSLLEQQGITQSLCRPGQCWDNAVAKELLRNPQGGTALPCGLADAILGQAGHLRVRRGLLQSPTTALGSGLPDTCCLRGTGERHQQGSGSTMNVSAKAGQSQIRRRRHAACR
jgi:transposase InsO family protein